MHKHIKIDANHNLQLKIPKASTFGRRGHIPLSPMASKLAIHGYTTDYYHFMIISNGYGLTTQILLPLALICADSTYIFLIR